MGWFLLPYLIFHLLLLLLHFPSYTFSLCNHHDSSALLQFKNSFTVSTAAEDWFDCPFSPSKTASWKNGTECCEWDGVTCNTMSGHVVGLDLSCSHLRGEFHPNSTIFQLKHLQQLNLAFNNFSSSPIYSGISDLMNLTHLNLSCSALSGDIPSTISQLSKLVSLDLSCHWDIGMDMRLDPSTWKKLILNTTNLRELILDGIDMSSIKESSLSVLMNLSSSLVSLHLSDTELQGNFPSDILSLPNLQELDLSFNQELRGQLPKSNWSTSLRYLHLSSTGFSGEIPNSISNLKSLNQLDLSACKFNGLLPLSLWNLTQLTDLNLVGNNLTGEIPSLISNLKHLTSFDLSALLQNLRVLDLSNNTIQGKIPKFFHDNLLHSWKDIQEIDLSFNKLQGDLPIPPYGTRHFSVSNNNFTGGISSTLCNASSLIILNLSHNNLTGMIPQCFGAFPFLWVLDMQMNNLYGSLPSFSERNTFETIKLNGNRLEGPLPQSLVNCTYLQVFDLGSNKIEDTFPNWLETLQELQVLSLRSNKLHGDISCFSTEHPFPMLRIFDVSNNNFSGPLPVSCIKNFQGMMNVMDDQTGLQYMGKDSYYDDSVVVIMKGDIPQVIGDLNSLKGLNLSHNQITGIIPQSLSNLRNLEWLDLSWNQLTGEIPGNNLIHLEIIPMKEIQCCVDSLLLKSCNKDEEQPPNSTFHHEEQKSGFGWKAVAVGYACGAVFGMLLGCNVFLTGKPQWLVRLIESMFNIRVKRTINRSRANRSGVN
ncbi:Leucine-rich repeat [Sesbania bispinosa]|nr:Leucine-rich repeat [Sesbania bispinosa]